MLRESQAIPAKDRKAALGGAFLPKDKDSVELAELAVCALVYQLTCRLALGELSEDAIDETMKTAIDPWIRHLQGKGAEAPLAFEALFRFYHNLTKSPDAITGMAIFFIYLKQLHVYLSIC